jgi:hypothetical protein
MKKLRVLLLDDTQITNAGLTFLRHIPNLHFLNVEGTRVTDTACRDLVNAVGTLDINQPEITRKRNAMSKGVSFD